MTDIEKILDEAGWPADQGNVRIREAFYAPINADLADAVDTEFPAVRDVEVTQEISA